MDPPDRPTLASVVTESRVGSHSDEVVDRLALPLRRDGTIVLDSLRSATKEKLTTALKDPALARMAGTATAPPDGALDESLCELLFNASSSVLIMLGRRAGYSSEQASVLAFSRDETKMLAPLTARVLNKWVPAGGYQDEIALAVALVAIVSGKMALLRKSAQVLPMEVPRSSSSSSSSTGTDNEESQPS